jgi:hypothetical protein
MRGLAAGGAAGGRTGTGAQPRPAGGHFDETLDWDSATIQARGHLTAQGADLIRGAVEVLRRSGRHRITVDLCAVGAADDEALAAVHSLARGLRAHRGELVVLSQATQERS